MDACQEVTDAKSLMSASPWGPCESCGCAACAPALLSHCAFPLWSPTVPANPRCGGRTDGEHGRAGRRGQGLTANAVKQQ